MLLDYVLWLANRFGAKIVWVDNLGDVAHAAWNESPSRHNLAYVGSDTFWFKRGYEDDPVDLLHEVHHYIIADDGQRAEPGFGPDMAPEDETETCRMDIYTLSLFDPDLAARWRRYTNMEDDNQKLWIRTKPQIRDDVRRFKKTYVKQDVHA